MLNNLFNFIQISLPHLKQTALTDCNQITLTKNQEGQAYYLLELDHQKPVSFSDETHQYHLSSHHISVYSTENESNPVLSQYHYTAYFTDESTNHYQLHVYFNQKDELTIAPVFSINEQGNYKVIDSKLLNDSFIRLAETVSEPVIKTLRKKLGVQIEQLEIKFKQSEAVATELSSKWPDNHQEYMAALSALLAVLTPLSKLVPHYVKTQEFIANMQNELQSALDKQTHDKSLSEKEIIPQAHEESKTFKHQNVTVPTFFKQQALPKKNACDLKLNIESLQKRFDALSQLTEVEQAEELANLWASAHAQMLSATDEVSQIERQQGLVHLQKLFSNIQQHSNQLILHLLFAKQFDAVKKLPNFNSLLTPKLFKMALTVGNHELLDFVLTHSSYIPLEQPLTGMKNYTSPVHYCVQENSEKKPLYPCLSVLIKHGASIFLPGKDGLPLVYGILKTPNHPLYKSLIDQSEKTLESKTFYQKLISALNKHLPTVQSKEQQAIIQNDIESFTWVMQQLKQDNKLTGAKLLKDRFKQFLQKNEGKIQHGEQIKRDPDIIKQAKILNAAYEKFKKNCTSQQQRQHDKEVRTTLDHVDSALDFLGENQYDYETIKKETLAHLRNTTLFYEKQYELIDVQNKLKKPITGRNAERKQMQMIKEQNRLVKEINGLAEKHSQPLQLVENLSVQIKSFNDLCNSLNKMVGAISSLTTQGTSKDNISELTDFFNTLKHDSFCKDIHKDCDDDEENTGNTKLKFAKK